MSYDISLVMKDALGDDHKLVEVGNYTYNCGPMFARALEAGGLPFVTLSGCNGRRADDMAAFLTTGLAYWDAHPAEFSVMDPTNRWGDSLSAREYMGRLLDACVRFPSATVSVS